jgi:hypothetical protein
MRIGGIKLRTIEELKQFYDVELYPHLLELEKVRKKARFRVVAFHTIMAVITGSALIGFTVNRSAASSGKGFIFNICLMVWIIGGIFIVPSRYSADF